VAQLNNRGITIYRSNDNTQASAIVLTIYTTSRLVCWQFFGKNTACNISYAQILE